jgi:hypothetical protein
VYGQIGEKELEKALRRACAEAQAELEHHLRFLKGKDYSRVLGFAPREGVEVWEGELEGVEVVEVKTGAGRLSKPQRALKGTTLLFPTGYGFADRDILI